jgi:hypothetical protein
MASLSIAELQKRNNIDIFLNKWKNGDEFTFTDKQQRTLPPYHEATATILRKAVKGDPKAVRLIQRDVVIQKLLQLSKIQKTSEFGSRGGAGGGAGVANEKFLIDMLKSHMVSTPMTIAFIAGSKQFIVNDVLDVQGAGTNTSDSKKSDVNLIVGTTSIPLSLKQEDAGGWESSDKLFRDAGTKLIDALSEAEKIDVAPRLASAGGGDVILNRVVAMEATVNEQTVTAFGSDITVKKGAIVVRTFKNGDVSYNAKKNRLEVQVSEIYQTLRDIPEQKKPTWVIRNQRGRKSLPKYPGLRTEMKIAKYAMSTTARVGRFPPLVIKIEERGDYELSGDIVRS